MRTEYRRLWAACLLAVSAAAVRGQETIVQFNGNITPSSGPGTPSFFNGTTTSSFVSFGTASSFGIPALPGGDAQVIHVPALTAADNNKGIVFQPNAAANGGGTKINQYTIGYDVLFASTPGFATFHNITGDIAAGATTDDAELFRRDSGGGGIGISGQYDGTTAGNTWYRVMITMDATAGAQGTMKKYIDGNLVSTQTNLSNGGVDLRFAIDPAAPTTNGLVLFNDEDGESADLYVNSFYFNSTVLTDQQIQALGTANAAGFAPVPEPGAVLAVAAAGVGLVQLARRVRRKAG